MLLVCRSPRPGYWLSLCYNCEIGALASEEHGWSDRALRGRRVSGCPEAASVFARQQFLEQVETVVLV